MVCPICEKTVTFPAVPPGKAKSSLHVKRETAKETKEWLARLGPIIKSLNRFKHWNVLFACLVPFLIVGGLLFGASFMKQHFGDDAGQNSPQAVHADPAAWQKMTELAKADELMQQHVRNVIAAHDAYLGALAKRNSLHAYYQGKYADASGMSAVNAQFNSADQAVGRAQSIQAAARQAFESAFRDYQNLGGKIDYHQQLPPQ